MIVLNIYETKCMGSSETIQEPIMDWADIMTPGFFKNVSENNLLEITLKLSPHSGLFVVERGHGK